MIDKWFFSAIEIISLYDFHDVSITYLLYALINVGFPSNHKSETSTPKKA